MPTPKPITYIFLVLIMLVFLGVVKPIEPIQRQLGFHEHLLIIDLARQFFYLLVYPPTPQNDSESELNLNHQNDSIS